MKRLMFFNIVMCLLCVSCNYQKSSPPQEAPVTDAPTVVEDSADDVQDDEKVYAPDFDIIYLNGDSGGKLSGLKGKPVLLNFWATWCGPCVIEMPHIQKIYTKYSDKISIIAVNVGENTDDVQKFIDNNNYGFPIATDLELSIGRLYNVQSIPQTFLIDEDGVIVDFISGSASEDLLVEVVESAIAD